jgi:hypothetical protein
LFHSRYQSEGLLIHPADTVSTFKLSISTAFLGTNALHFALFSPSSFSTAWASRYYLILLQQQQQHVYLEVDTQLS